MEWNQICKDLVIYLGLCGFRTQIFCSDFLETKIDSIESQKNDLDSIFQGYDMLECIGLTLGFRHVHDGSVIDTVLGKVFASAACSFRVGFRSFIDFPIVTTARLLWIVLVSRTQTQWEVFTTLFYPSVSTIRRDTRVRFVLNCLMLYCTVC